ncbi:MAG: endopeptidase La, partial [Gammaproteobacteria bacterium]|nr:endopeptidase La [Gammaproteobacteria bacterium]
QGEAALVGERRTRPESRPGRILQGLRDQGARDVVILLEELDTIGVGKVQGDPAAALEEILDWECRDRFVDRYLDIPFDLQDVMFVATARDFFRIPHDIREMLVEIRLAGYTPEEKVAIARARMVPRMVGQHGLDTGDVALDGDALAFLARGYARDAGLEGMRRVLATLLRTRARAKATGDRDAWTFDQDRIIDIL